MDNNFDTYSKQNFEEDSNISPLNNSTCIYSLDNFEALGMGPHNFYESKYAHSFLEPHNIFDINIKDNSNKHGKNCLSEQFSKNQIDNMSMSYLQKENIFLGKKRKIFKVIYRKNFSVFSFGEYNKESRKIINETLDDIKNGKKFFSFLDESESPKQPTKKSINIWRRKHNSDNIIKKIKTKYHKILKIQTNKILKNVGSKKFFKNLPQVFITNLKKEEIRSILNKTYKDILTNNFIEWQKPGSKGKNNNNYLYNKSVLEYLEKNKNRFKELNYNMFNMTYSQLYNEYLESVEFEEEIANLTKKETLKYTKNYILKANNFINFFHMNKM